MKLTNIGLKCFDSDELEVYVVMANEDGTSTDIKLSSLLDVSSEAATARAKQDIGATRLK